MHEALACLSPSAHWYAGPTPRDEVLALLHRPAAIPLRAGGRELFLVANQHFRYRWDEEAERYYVTSLAYRYTLAADAMMQGECIAWHWQPKTSPYPHLHIQGSHPALGDLHRLHLPTARISFESLTRFLIHDLGVKCFGPQGWEELLRQNEHEFVHSRQWHHDRELDDEAAS